MEILGAMPSLAPTCSAKQPRLIASVGMLGFAGACHPPKLTSRANLKASFIDRVCSSIPGDGRMRARMFAFLMALPVEANLAEFTLPELPTYSNKNAIVRLWLLSRLHDWLDRRIESHGHLNSSDRR
jgi:hypothetical protein